MDDKKDQVIRVLIIDDESDIRDLMQDYLSFEYNFEIDTAVDGKDALNLLNHNKYDLIFTDYHMPNVNGYEFVKMLREGNNISNKCPVILITGFSPDFNPEENVWKDVFLIEKPFNFDNIKFLIKCTLKNKIKYSIKKIA
jgi:CheY-like chemotaxis protein